MYCPPKLPFFIKKCSLKLRNLLYVFICIVLLNYPFSLKNVPQTSQFAIYTYMYCPPKLPFFLKKSSLKLHNLLYIFICINTFFQYIDVQQTVLYSQHICTL